MSKETHVDSNHCTTKAGPIQAKKSVWTISIRTVLQMDIPSSENGRQLGPSTVDRHLFFNVRDRYSLVERAVAGKKQAWPEITGKHEEIML